VPAFVGYARKLAVGREALGLSAQANTALRTLVGLPVDRLMVRWVHTVLEQSAAAAVTTGTAAAAEHVGTRKFIRIENFGSDFAVRACCGCRA